MPSLKAAKIFDPSEREYRVRYVARTIMRDRIANEGAFKNCLEMEDGEQVIQIILRRGIKNPKLRAALHRSHLINLDQWLRPYPALLEAYYFSEPVAAPDSKLNREKRP
jgi:hypothetical protein